MATKQQRTKAAATRRNGKVGTSSRKKSTTSGKSSGKADKKKVSAPTKSVALTEDEKKVFSPLRSEIDRVKGRIADLTLAIQKAEQQRTALIQHWVDLDSTLVKKANEVAQSYGIDTEDPASGRWNLDFDGGVIERVD